MGTSLYPNRLFSCCVHFFEDILKLSESSLKQIIWLWLSSFQALMFALSVANPSLSPVRSLADQNLTRYDHEYQEKQGWGRGRGFVRGTQEKKEGWWWGKRCLLTVRPSCLRDFTFFRSTWIPPPNSYKSGNCLLSSSVCYVSPRS